ncbi:MAG: hypothetical protein R3D67_18735 [Hyphomicrobiaceae bacterium]
MAAASAAMAGGAAKPSAASAAAATTGSVPPAGAKADASKVADSTRPGNAAALPPSGGSSLGRIVSHLAAGVVGGAVALYGGPQLAPMLRSAGLPAPPAAEVPASLTQRIAALEQGLKAVPKPNPAADPAKAIAAAAANGKRIDEVAASVTALRGAQDKVAALADDLKARIAKDPPIADSAERIVKHEQQLKTLAAAAETEPKSAGRIAQLASIVGRVGDLEGRLTSEIQQVRKDVVREIDQRVAPATEASEAARTGTQRIDREVTAVKSEQNRIATGLDAVKTTAERLQLALKSTQDTTATLGSQLDGLKRDIDGRLKATAKPADVSSAIAPVATKLTSLEENLAGVVKSEAERKATAERIVLALELGNLKRALERGAPFARELGEVRKVAMPGIDLSPLEPYQNDGLQTLPELVRDFREVANTLIDAANDNADSSVVDRLLSGAKSFVRVRKTSHTKSDTSAEAIVGRMETALRSGRLGAVLAEAKALQTVPPAAKRWLDRVAARQSVEAALAKIDTALKSSLGAGQVPGDQKKVKP